MWNISKRLIDGKNYFAAVNPSFNNLFKNQVIKLILITKNYAIDAYKTFKTTGDVTETIAGSFGYYCTGKIIGLISTPVNTGYKFATMTRRSGFRTKTWITYNNDMNKDGRIIKNMTIIYHDANKAGKHLDIHIGHMSLIIRVSGKPVEKLIKFHQGKLTDDSKKHLINHIKEEISNNSRVAQNLDHSLNEAKSSWLYDETYKLEEGYGSGPTRQIVINEKVEILKIGDINSNILEMYIPSLDTHNILYLYRIYNGETTGTPICIFGKIRQTPPEFKDRLHLKMTNDINDFKNQIDESTVTIKYDGASAYLWSREKGSRMFSPRISKVTGERIEYTQKLPEIMRMKSDFKEVHGMGELLFYKNTIFGKKYLKAAEIGGILNSNSIRPQNIHPDYRLYRVDKIMGNDISNISFFDNRAIANEIANNCKIIHIPEIVKIKNKNNIEGYVGIPKNGNVNEGLKYKFFTDPDDWKVENINLYVTNKSKIAGVVNFISLESGKRFNLGPGQIGNFDDCYDIINNSNNYIGKVAKVISRYGHEGRASKLLEWHLDK